MNKNKKSGETDKIKGVKHKISNKKKSPEEEAPPEEQTENKANFKPGDRKKKN
jgi:hypothetical protein